MGMGMGMFVSWWWVAIFLFSFFFYFLLFLINLVGQHKILRKEWLAKQPLDVSLFSFLLFN